jgi:hypothetical protein
MPPTRQPDETLLTRIRGEFREMPGLRLTFGQAQRLWQLEAHVCEAVLERLVSEGFLVRNSGGNYSTSHPVAMAASTRASRMTAA